VPGARRRARSSRWPGACAWGRTWRTCGHGTVLWWRSWAHR
jgi:hypothetical protein